MPTKEEYLTGGILALPGVAPFATPYYVAKGRFPSTTELIIAMYGGMATGALTKGGSLFVNYHPKFGMVRFAAPLTAVMLTHKYVSKVAQLDKGRGYQSSMTGQPGVGSGGKWLLTPGKKSFNFNW